MRVVVKAATDLGQKRDHNEDYHVVWAPEEGSDKDKGVLLLVADGMGGSQAGEVASRMAAQSFVKEFRSSQSTDTLAAAESALEQANGIVHQDSLEHPDRRGMGTTCTAVIIKDEQAVLAHVGDSRAYLVRNGEIRQLTQDHSLVAQLVRDNQITEEQARVDPRRNVVTRSVGVGAHVEIDAVKLDTKLKHGDTIVVSSDGLHGMVTDGEIAALASSESLDQAVRKLIDLANERGGPDNITAILARVENLADTAEMDTNDLAGLDTDEPLRRVDFDAAETTGPVAQAPAAAATYPMHAAGHAQSSGPGPRRSTRETTLLLIIAFIVLAMLVGVMGLVVSHLTNESQDLTHSTPTTQQRRG